MELILYANAYKTQVGNDWSVSITDSFCIGGKIHVQRRRRVSEKIAHPHNESWSAPQPCDGTCRIWKKKLNGMPPYIRNACQLLLKI